jgi:hypothetical protein
MAYSENILSLLLMAKADFQPFTVRLHDGRSFEIAADDDFELWRDHPTAVALHGELVHLSDVAVLTMHGSDTVAATELVKGG